MNIAIEYAGAKLRLQDSEPLENRFAIVPEVQKDRHC